MSESTKTRMSPLINRYASGGPILLYAITGLTPDHERAAPGTGAGAWTIAELMAHLLDTELVFAERMKRVIAEDNPTLVSFDENRWALRLSYPDSPVADAGSMIAMNRKWTSRILRTCSESDFARSGTHTEKGKMTLADLLAYVTNHLDHHLKFLYTKRANLGAAITPRYGSEQIGTLVQG